MEKGDKAKAEHFGAQAKIQSWKDQLKNPPPPATAVDPAARGIRRFDSAGSTR